MGHDRYGLRCLLRLSDGDRADSVNYVDFVPYQRSDQPGDVGLVLRRMEVDTIVLSVDVALVLETSAEGRDVLPDSVVDWAALGSHHGDAGDLLGLLRLGRVRRSQSPKAQPAQERAPVHHWISSSARTRIDCGIVRPSALAVLTLMTSTSVEDGCRGV